MVARLHQQQIVNRGGANVARLQAKEPDTLAPERWPADIGEQMAAAHRIYPKAADPRLVELLKLAEELGAPH